MMKRLILLFVLAFSLTSLSAQNYRNPLSPRAADCFVAKFGDFYYMVGTPCPGNTEMQWAGVWKSRDMVNWSGPYFAYAGDDRDKPLWASEIYHKGDSYYMITTCAMWNAGNTMMVQRAPTPLGPYSLYCHLPKKGLDPGFFVDTDGKSYLLDSEYVAPLNDEWTRMTGDFVGHRDTKEGPFLLKNDNRYIRLHPRIEEGYPLEYEVASTPSPYTDDYVPHGRIFTGVGEPGHGSITASPDGTELFFVSHFRKEGGGWEDRFLAMDRICFGPDGLPEPGVRTTDPQPAPSAHLSGVDVARGKWVNSSGILDGNSPLAVIDGNPETCWQAEEFLEIDLTGEFQIARVEAVGPSGKECTFRATGSVDRLNWHPVEEGWSRFVRLSGFSEPAVSEVHIYPVERVVPVWSPDVSVSCKLDRELERGVKESFLVDVPRSGHYDCVARFRIQDGFQAEWALYDGDRLLDKVAGGHTGVADNEGQMITFDIPLEAGRHNFSIVGEQGRVYVDAITLHLLEEPGTYTNPVWSRVAADPAVMRAPDGLFYVYATQGVSPEGIMCNIQVLRSADLVQWEHLGDALPEKPKWSSQTNNFWAPHVMEAGGRYYMYYSAEPDPQVKTGKDLGLCLGVAVSDNPAGPFRDMGKPLLSGDSFINIDPMSFQDPVSGDYYLYWGSGFEPLKVRRLAPDLMSFAKKSETVTLVNPFQHSYQFLVEGSWMLYKDGWYYLFYSGDNCCGEGTHYAVMVARSTSPTGPFEVLKHQVEGDYPILEANDSWIGPGHNSVIMDDNGDYWILYHAIRPGDRYDRPDQKSGDRRIMLMDRLVFRDGWPMVEGLSPSTHPVVAPYINGTKPR